MTTSPRRLALVATTLVTALALPLRASAQIRASELATVSQTIDGTVVTLEYYRPRLRGRTGIFGTPVVRWGETWTPGANWATTLEVSRDVTIDGRAVPRGRYSMWMVVRATGDWTLLLDTKVRRLHLDPPDTATVALRLPVRPQRGPATEVLTWSFPELRTSGATLAMQWDTVRVALDVRVSPSLTVTTPETEARPFVGTYDVTRTPADIRQLVVTYEKGTLRGDFVPRHPYFNRFALIRVAPDTYVMGLYDKGEIYEVMRSEMTFNFSRAPGRPASVELRAEDDSLFWAGARTP